MLFHKHDALLYMTLETVNLLPNLQHWDCCIRLGLPMTWASFLHTRSQCLAQYVAKSGAKEWQKLLGCFFYDCRMTILIS